MNFSNYNKNLKDFAREKRNDSTLGEIIIWKKLLSGKKLGYQFNRQFPIDNYIVDFVSRKLKLIIEIDGYSHLFKHAKDLKRDAYFLKLGYTVLRFEERDVKNSFENVTRCLVNYVEEFEKKNSLKLSPFSKEE
jgi:very-short-patch-repair endonuclease